MRPAVLTMAALFGLAALGGTAQAMPAVSATVVIESGTVLVGGERHDRFHRTPRAHWHKGLAGHHKHWQVRSTKHRHKTLARHHSRWYGHRPAFVGKRFHRAPVVIVRPAPRAWLGHRHLPPRPLIRHGSFAWGHRHR